MWKMGELCRGRRPGTGEMGRQSFLLNAIDGTRPIILKAIKYLRGGILSLQLLLVTQLGWTESARDRIAIIHGKVKLERLTQQLRILWIRERRRVMCFDGLGVNHPRAGVHAVAIHGRRRSSRGWRGDL